MAAASPWIVQTSDEAFQQDVLDRSGDLPVVVDFWASWCQPCRMLSPILERLAQEYAGKFVLVKAQTETMPLTTAAFGVQAIPAVFAIREGRVVDQFVGLLSEPEIRAWLEHVLPSRAETLSAEAQSLEKVDPVAAEAKYREAVGLAPNDVSAKVGLARTLLARGELAEGKRIIEELAGAGLLDSEGERLQAELVLREQAQQCGSVQQCRDAVQAAPDNLALRLDLVRALAAAGQYDDALRIALEVVQKDRRGFGEAGRELMVHIFHLLGPDSELASAYRRKLALALY